MTDPKNTQKPNPRTVEAVHAERNRLMSQARDLDSQMRVLLGDSDVLATFQGAALRDPSKPFALGGLAAKFKGKYGITDANLNLTKDDVERLPETTDEKVKKKKALLLKFELEAFAKDVAEKQAKALWQQHILFGALLDSSPAAVGFVAGSAGSLSLDDLTHLNSSKTRALMVLDEKNFPASVDVIVTDGGAAVKISPATTSGEIRGIVNKLAATGCNKLTIDCKSTKDFDQYRMMGEQAILEMLRNGHAPMKLVANEPHYVKSPGLMRTNPKTGKREPQDVRKRAAYHKGKAEQQFFQDIANNMPQDAATAADAGARMAITYAGLQQKHKGRYLKMLADSDMGLKISDMAGYFLRTGQMDKLVELQRDVKQHLGVNMSGKVEQYVRSQMGAISTTELNTALDNSFDHTVASRHYENLNLNGVASPPMRIIKTMVAAMSPNQVANYAKHLAGHQDMSQVNERAGMILTHGTDAQRDAFVKAYLEEIHRKSCEKHGIKPGVIAQIPVVPTPAPPALATRPERDAERVVKYQKVQADVQAAADSLLSGTRDYARRTEEPNGNALNRAHAASNEVVGNLAAQRFDDRNNLPYPVALGLSPADRVGYVGQAQQAYAAASSAAAFDNNRNQFANQQPAQHVRAP